MMSGVELHHHVVRFLWRLVPADGRAGETSIDVGALVFDAYGTLFDVFYLSRFSAPARASASFSPT